MVFSCLKDLISKQLRTRRASQLHITYLVAFSSSISGEPILAFHYPCQPGLMQSKVMLIFCGVVRRRSSHFANEHISLRIKISKSYGCIRSAPMSLGTAKKVWESNSPLFFFPYGFSFKITFYRLFFHPFLRLYLISPP